MDSEDHRQEERKSRQAMRKQNDWQAVYESSRRTVSMLNDAIGSDCRSGEKSEAFNQYVDNIEHLSQMTSQWIDSHRKGEACYEDTKPAYLRRSANKSRRIRKDSKSGNLSKAAFDFDVKDTSPSSGPTLDLDFESALREGTFKQYLAANEPDIEKDGMSATSVIPVRW